jgi:enoyl-CoA hydratase/carnithine racemase
MLHNANMQGIDRGISESPNAIATGSNSGYQAINIAVLAGAKRILLLGYDMKFAAGKKSHWHGGHPLQMPEGAYTRYARKFKTMLPQLERLGVAVINCTPGSAIDAFPRGDIASLLSHPG